MLKIAIGKARYGTPVTVEKSRTQDLENINELRTENQDLKAQVGKIRYAKPVDHTGEDVTIQPSPEWYRKIGNGPPPAAEVKNTRNSDSESESELTKLQIVQEEELEDDLLNNSMKHVKHSDKGHQSNFEAFDQPKFPQLPDKVIYAPDLSVDRQEAEVGDEETERDDSLNNE